MTGKAVLDRVLGPDSKPLDLQRSGWRDAVLNNASASFSHSSTNICATRPAFRARIREVAILTAAREADSQFEWVQHEAIALREGLEPAVIDVIRHRKSTAGFDPVRGSGHSSSAANFTAQSQGDAGNVRASIKTYCLVRTGPSILSMLDGQLCGDGGAYLRRSTCNCGRGRFRRCQFPDGLPFRNFSRNNA